MKKGGEWGQFFPHALSSFAYNETIASVYFPLSREEVEKKGWRWKEDGEEKKQQQYLGPEVPLPDDSANADESLCSQIFRCEATSNLYKIIPAELTFYKKMRLPLPRFCFE